MHEVRVKIYSTATSRLDVHGTAVRIWRQKIIFSVYILIAIVIYPGDNEMHLVITMFEKFTRVVNSNDGPTGIATLITEQPQVLSLILYSS